MNKESSAPARVELARVRAEAAAWPRNELNDERVSEFRDLYLGDGFTALPPIELVRLDDGSYLLADGWHRLAALAETTAEEVPAVVYTLATDDDPFAFAYARALACSALSSKP